MATQENVKTRFGELRAAMRRATKRRKEEWPLGAHATILAQLLRDELARS
jgi:hypothetical protein